VIGFVYCGWRWIHQFGHQFGQVDGLHLAFQAGHLDGIFHVDQAEGAGRDDDVGPGLGGHLHPQHAHALLFLGFVKKHQPAAAATEGTVPAALHFHPSDPPMASSTARGLRRLVVAAQVAGS
jgi:hypothetical protein